MGCINPLVDYSLQRPLSTSGVFIFVCMVWYRFIQSALLWLPRIVGLAYVASTLLMAIISALNGSLVTACLFMLHCILLAIAWRFKRIGGSLYIGLALVFSLYFVLKFKVWSIAIAIAGPLLITGLLFWFDATMSRVLDNRKIRVL
jgi:hypothetical protein